jgi:hypothetical protein
MGAINSFLRKFRLLFLLVNIGIFGIFIRLALVIIKSPCLLGIIGILFIELFVFFLIQLITSSHDNIGKVPSIPSNIDQLLGFLIDLNTCSLSVTCLQHIRINNSMVSGMFPPDQGLPCVNPSHPKQNNSRNNTDHEEPIIRALSLRRPCRLLLLCEYYGRDHHIKLTRYCHVKSLRESEGSHYYQVEQRLYLRDYMCVEMVLQ